MRQHARSRDWGAAEDRNSAKIEELQQVSPRLYRLLPNSVKKIIECLPAVVTEPPPGGVRGHDDGHPVRIATDHSSPISCDRVD